MIKVSWSWCSHQLAAGSKHESQLRTSGRSARGNGTRLSWHSWDPTWVACHQARGSLPSHGGLCDVGSSVSTDFRSNLH